MRWMAMLTVGLLLAHAQGARAQTVLYAEDFELQPVCSTSCGSACVLSASDWENATTDDMDWIVDSGGTATTQTGPGGDHTSGSGRYAYLEASSSCSPSQTANLVSVELDLTAAASPYLELWYHMYGADMGTLHLDIGSYGGTGFTPSVLDAMAPLTDDRDLWQRRVVDLSPYAGSTIALRLRGVTGPDFHSDMAIDDITVYERAPTDVGVTSIDSPATDCSSSASGTVTVTLTNFGADEQTSVPLELLLDGATVAAETYTGTLPGAGGTDTHTFATTLAFSATDPHTIQVRSGLAGDADATNDTATRDLAAPLLPGVEDFEGGAGPWDTGGTTSFELATPPPGAFSGSNAWATGAFGNYGNREDGWVGIACGYDLSGLSEAGVRLRIYRDGIQSAADGAVLEVSTDAGASWTPVGDASGTTGTGWYGDGAIAALPAPQDGWSGDGGGWQEAAHPLIGLGGMTDVRFRVRFASDGSVTGPGFYFDDFEVFDNTPRLLVRNGPMTAPFGAVDEGSADLLVQAIDLLARGSTTKTLTELTVTEQGTIADAEVETAQLWVDDGDGVFDAASDVAVASSALSGGAATFTPATAIDVPAPGRTRLFVTFDLAAVVTGGRTVATAVAAPSDVVVAGTDPVAFDDGAVEGPYLTVFAPATPPYADDFDGSAPPANRRAAWSAGLSYPTAAAGGSVGAPTVTVNDAVVRESAGVDAGDGAGGTVRLDPASGSSMGAISFAHGSAAGAMDYYFDMSGTSAGEGPVLLDFAWNAANEEQDDLDAVFVSVDGGATWAAVLHPFVFGSSATAGWTSESVDVSAALADAGAAWSSDVVVRFQAGGNAELGVDGLLVDDVTLTAPPKVAVRRVGSAADVVEGGTDDLMARPVGETIALTYEITNSGGRTLDLVDGSFATTGGANVSGVTVTQPSDLSLEPGESTTYAVELSVDAEAAFSLDVQLESNGAGLSGGVFAYTIAGVGVVPTLDVQRPAGTSIPTGGTDDVGASFVGVAETLTYTIENAGSATADLTGVTPVAIAGETDASAMVSAQPTATMLAPGETDTFEVAYTPTYPGTFSFDVAVSSASGTEATFTVTGTAEMAGEDGGVSPGDGGMAPDGGMPPGDGGAPPADGAMPTGDAGMPAGDGGMGEGSGGGCCSVAPPPGSRRPNRLGGLLLICAVLTWLRGRGRA